jgi:hypothetical protein
VKADVWVDGRRWRQVASFAEARPEAEVYVLDGEDRTVEFGDGVNGKRPPMGAEVIVAVYRHGAGGGGDVGSEGPPIRTCRDHVIEKIDLALWTVIRTQRRSIPLPTPRREPGPAG